MYKKLSLSATILISIVSAINADSSDNSLGIGDKALIALENIKKTVEKVKTTALENQSSHPIQSPYSESEVVYFDEPADFSWATRAVESCSWVKRPVENAVETALENQSSHPIQSPYCESEVVYFDEPADFSWLTKVVRNAVENASIHNVQNPFHESEVVYFDQAAEADLPELNWMKNGFEYIVQNGTSEKIDAYGRRNPFYDTECIDIYDVSAVGKVGHIDQVAQQPSWYEKVWNAEIAGYQGAGKYVIIGSAVAIASVVAAYYAGLFDSKTSFDKQVDALILKAQKNPNIIIVELPKILEACQNDQERSDILDLVLKNIEITPEIQQAFEL